MCFDLIKESIVDKFVWLVSIVFHIVSFILYISIIEGLHKNLDLLPMRTMKQIEIFNNIPISNILNRLDFIRINLILAKFQNLNLHLRMIMSTPKDTNLLLFSRFNIYIYIYKPINLFAMIHSVVFCLINDFVNCR